MAERGEQRTHFDGTVEALSRRLASHRTRRSFMGLLGKGALLVAGGSTFVGLFADRAEARVCGQSGVSPKCRNYDCENAVWGWCWYANGCCAGGRLKKICDCCAPVNNVHGYCPSGTNVKCIVESCGNDPRVQTVPISRVQTDNALTLALAFSRVRFGRNSKPTVTVANSEDLLASAVAATVAAAAGGPLLLTSGNDLDAQVAAEVQRLGSTDAKVVGLGGPNSIDSRLTAYGCAVERLSTAGDHGGMSVDVANWVRARSGTNRAICIESTGLGLAIAPVAGAAAATKKMVLMVGAGAAAAQANSGVVLTYMVGPEAAARSGEVAGSKPVRANDSVALAAEIAGFMTGIEETSVSTIALAPWSNNSGLAASPGLVLLHARPNNLDGARDWMFSHRAGFRQTYAIGESGALNNDGYYETQSVVNGFEAHLLIGEPGQGLPVISQPDGERPLGRARNSGPVENVNAGSSYWTNRG